MLMHGSLTIFILSGLLFALLVYLGVENLIHQKFLHKIPTRITVTGTRGKTSTVRLIASILRQSGYRVLAKTTGTVPNYILPDGRDEAIQRRGLTNILEQKKLIRKAAKLHVDFLVCETMSIQPENHWVESQKLLKPHYTVLTNLRPDHLDHYNEENMSEMIINDLYDRSALIAPEGELPAEISEEIDALGMKFITCQRARSYEQNQALATTLAQELGLSANAISEGIQKVIMVIGQFEEFKLETKVGSVVFTNAFAANDPISSELLIKEILAKYSPDQFDIWGLFSLRKDRGERSQQWLDYLRSGGKNYFNEMYFSGTHSHLVTKKLGQGKKIESKAAESITAELIEALRRPTVVIGLVNIVGTGTELITHWKEICTMETANNELN